MNREKHTIEQLRRSLQLSVTLNVFMALAMLLGVVLSLTDSWPKWEPEKWFRSKGAPSPYSVEKKTEPDSMTLAVARKLTLWQGKNADYAPANDTGELIRYGRELIANTAAYLGPKGSVARITNGMNCQNCHLDAGTRPWGNNYGAVAPTYPKFRERSGSEEDIYKRVSDCIERSLNGKTLPQNSREMQAMIQYINWLGRDIPNKETPNGSGIVALPFLARAADPAKGKEVYAAKCATCHAADGQGLFAPDGKTYAYPPLWGPHSYNIGAGLYRLSRFAGYVKYNMPFGATWQNPQLTDEECWDVAAFVNSQPRPDMDISADWPNLLGKPVDHPFGPFADGFSEKQHKFGPFQPIKDKLAALKKSK
jgi:thiosulfate dehydrogenase